MSNHDRTQFVHLLGRITQAQGWRLYAYVLMANHYHLLLTTPKPNLSEGMKRLGSLYAQSFNTRYSRWGHLFGGRFKSHQIDSDSHLVTAARYIVLNPVRAGLTISAEEWPWSSYQATAGISPPPKWLAVDSILKWFHLTDTTIAASEYRTFVAQGIGEPAAAIESGVRPLYKP